MAGDPETPSSPFLMAVKRRTLKYIRTATCRKNVSNIGHYTSRASILMALSAFGELVKVDRKADPVGTKYSAKQWSVFISIRDVTFHPKRNLAALRKLLLNKNLSQLFRRVADNLQSVSQLLEICDLFYGDARLSPVNLDSVATLNEILTSRETVEDSSGEHRPSPASYFNLIVKLVCKLPKAALNKEPGAGAASADNKQPKTVHKILSKAEGIGEILAEVARNKFGDPQQWINKSASTLFLIQIVSLCEDVNKHCFIHKCGAVLRNRLAHLATELTDGATKPFATTFFGRLLTEISVWKNVFKLSEGKKIGTEARQVPAEPSVSQTCQIVMSSRLNMKPVKVFHKYSSRRMIRKAEHIHQMASTVPDFLADTRRGYWNVVLKHMDDDGTIPDINISDKHGNTLLHIIFRSENSMADKSFVSCSLRCLKRPEIRLDKENNEGKSLECLFHELRFELRSTLIQRMCQEKVRSANFLPLLSRFNLNTVLDHKTGHTLLHACAQSAHGELLVTVLAEAERRGIIADLLMAHCKHGRLPLDYAGFNKRATELEAVLELAMRRIFFDILPYPT